MFRRIITVFLSAALILTAWPHAVYRCFAAASSSSFPGGRGRPLFSLPANSSQWNSGFERLARWASRSGNQSLISKSSPVNGFLGLSPGEATQAAAPMIQAAKNSDAIIAALEALPDEESGDPQGAMSLLEEAIAGEPAQKAVRLRMIDVIGSLQPGQPATQDKEHLDLLERELRRLDIYNNSLVSAAQTFVMDRKRGLAEDKASETGRNMRRTADALGIGAIATGVEDTGWTGPDIGAPSRIPGLGRRPLDADLDMDLGMGLGLRRRRPVKRPHVLHIRFKTSIPGRIWGKNPVSEKTQNEVLNRHNLKLTEETSTAFGIYHLDPDANPEEVVAALREESSVLFAAIESAHAFGQETKIKFRAPVRAAGEEETDENRFEIEDEEAVAALMRETDLAVGGVATDGHFILRAPEGTNAMEFFDRLVEHPAIERYEFVSGRIKYRWGNTDTRHKAILKDPKRESEAYAIFRFKILRAIVWISAIAALTWFFWGSSASFIPPIAIVLYAGAQLWLTIRRFASKKNPAQEADAETPAPPSRGETIAQIDVLREGRVEGYPIRSWEMRRRDEDALDALKGAAKRIIDAGLPIKLSRIALISRGALEDHPQNKRSDGDYFASYDSETGVFETTSRTLVERLEIYHESLPEYKRAVTLEDIAIAVILRETALAGWEGIGPVTPQRLRTAGLKGTPHHVVGALALQRAREIVSDPNKKPAIPDAVVRIAAGALGAVISVAGLALFLWALPGLSAAALSVSGLLAVAAAALGTLALAMGLRIGIGFSYFSREQLDEEVKDEKLQQEKTYYTEQLVAPSILKTLPFLFAMASYEELFLRWLAFGGIFWWSGLLPIGELAAFTIAALISSHIFSKMHLSAGVWWEYLTRFLPGLLFAAIFFANPDLLTVSLVHFLSNVLSLLVLAKLITAAQLPLLRIGMRRDLKRAGMAPAARRPWKNAAGMPISMKIFFWANLPAGVLVGLREAAIALSSSGWLDAIPGLSVAVIVGAVGAYWATRMAGINNADHRGLFNALRGALLVLVPVGLLAHLIFGAPTVFTVMLTLWALYELIHHFAYQLIDYGNVNRRGYTVAEFFQKLLSPHKRIPGKDKKFEDPEKGKSGFFDYKKRLGGTVGRYTRRP